MADPFDLSLDFDFDLAPKKRKKTLSPEDESSVLNQIFGSTMSGLGWMGDKLDIASGARPFRAIADAALYGDNSHLSELWHLPAAAIATLAPGPFKLAAIPFMFMDEVGLTSQEHNRTGKDLIRGIMPDDPNSWWDDIAGFATDVAADPGWFFSEGITDAGRIAQNANLMDDASDIATAAGRAAGKPARIGPQAAQATLNLADLIQTPAARKTAEDAAKGLGLDLAQQADQPLQGLFNVGITFGPQMTVGAGSDAMKWFGETGDALAGNIADAGIFGWKPLRHAAQMLDADVQGAGTKYGQEAMAKMSREALARNREPKEVFENLLGAFAPDGKPILDEDELAQLLEQTGKYQKKLPVGAQPWQLTKAEFRQAYPKQPISAHRKAIEDAIAAGHEIPSDVTAGYRNKAPLEATPVAGATTPPPALKIGKPLAREISDAEDAFLKQYPDFARAFDQYKTGTDDIREVQSAHGADIRYLQDSQVGRHSPRYAARSGKNVTSGRDVHLEEIVRGRSGLNEIAKGVAASGETTKKGIKKILRSQYANLIPEHLEEIADYNAAKLQADYKNMTPAAQAKWEKANPKPKLLDKLATTLRDWATTAAPESISAGLYPNHPLWDIATYSAKQFDRKANQDMVNYALKEYLLGQAGGKIVSDPNGVPLRKLWKDLKWRAATDPKGPAAHLMKELGQKIPQGKEFFKKAQRLANVKIPELLYQDIARKHKMMDGGAIGDYLANAADTANTYWKAGVLTWPARYGRDLISGQAQSFIHGNFSLGDADDAIKTVFGQDVEGAAKLPPVRKMLERMGVNPDKATPKQATEALRRHIAAMTFLGGQVADASRAPGEKIGTLDDLLAARPGSKSSGSIIGDVAGAFEDAFTSGTINPLSRQFYEVPGAFGVTEPGNAIQRLGNAAGNTSDSLNRIVLYLNELKRGTDPAVAAKKVLDMQVDYDPRAYSEFDRVVLQRMFPFWKYTKKMAAFVASELARNPNGPLAKVIKAEAAAGRRDPNEQIPEHLRQTMAIPLGEEDGMQSYLTGLGLMHEDPLSMFNVGGSTYHTAQNVLAELGGKLNPLIKTPIEVMSGRQLFSGRNLEDLDSNIGRIASNAWESATGEKVQPWEAPILLEQALAASMFSRAASTGRMLTDPRKGAAEKAINFTTGVRTTTIDKAKEGNLATRKALEEILRGSPGVYRFEHLFAPNLDDLSPNTRRVMELYNKRSLESQKAARDAKPKKSSRDMFDLTF